MHISIEYSEATAQTKRDTSRIAGKMHDDVDKPHGEFPCFSPQLQHHSRLGIRTINVAKDHPRPGPQDNINSSIYHHEKLTLTLTSMLEIGCACLDQKGNSVLDIKIGAWI